MKFFLDTAEITEIERGLELGVLDGITTNPTHIANSQRPFLEVAKEICKLVPGPVSLEVTGLTADKMLQEARELGKIGDNVVIKIPLTWEGIKAIKELSKAGIKTNATLSFSANQALLAAKVGATYVSPFVGRLDQIGGDGGQLIREIRQVYDNYGYATEILVASVRHPNHVLDAALVGADVCTMGLATLEALIEHPLTEKGLDKFLKDWQRVKS